MGCFVPKPSASIIGKDKGIDPNELKVDAQEARDDSHKDLNLKGN